MFQWASWDPGRPKVSAPTRTRAGRPRCSLRSTARSFLLAPFTSSRTITPRRSPSRVRRTRPQSPSRRPPAPVAGATPPRSRRRPPPNGIRSHPGVASRSMSTADARGIARSAKHSFRHSFPPTIGRPCNKRARRAFVRLGRPLLPWCRPSAASAGRALPHSTPNRPS